jgi:hypothetical protein
VVDGGRSRAKTWWYSGGRGGRQRRGMAGATKDELWLGL